MGRPRNPVPTSRPMPGESKAIATQLRAPVVHAHLLTVCLPSKRKLLESEHFIRRSKVALPHWLRECIQVTDQDQGPEQDENVMPFPRRSIEPVRNDGQSAIDLVYHAA